MTTNKRYNRVFFFGWPTNRRLFTLLAMIMYSVITTWAGVDLAQPPATAASEALDMGSLKGAHDESADESQKTPKPWEGLYFTVKNGKAQLQESGDAAKVHAHYWAVMFYKDFDEDPYGIITAHSAASLMTTASFLKRAMSECSMFINRTADSSKIGWYDKPVAYLDTTLNQPPQELVNRINDLSRRIDQHCELIHRIANFRYGRADLDPPVTNDPFAAVNEHLVAYATAFVEAEQKLLAFNLAIRNKADRSKMDAILKDWSDALDRADLEYKPLNELMEHVEKTAGLCGQFTVVVDDPDLDKKYTFGLDVAIKDGMITLVRKSGITQTITVALKDLDADSVSCLGEWISISTRQGRPAVKVIEESKQGKILKTDNKISIKYPTPERCRVAAAELERILSAP